jgi:hypothetical protein
MFDLFYPGVLPGSTKQVQLAGSAATELVTSLVNALAYQAIGVNDLLARTHGHILFDNSKTTYSSALPALIPDAAYGGVNAGIRAISGDAGRGCLARAQLRANGQPTDPDADGAQNSRPARALPSRGGIPGPR